MRALISLAIFLLMAGSFLHVALSDELSFGNPSRTEMDDYFIANGQRQTGANNIVAAVLFDYRGIDTLGEASVLFVAVLGVGLVIRRAMAPGSEGDGERGESP